MKPLIMALLLFIACGCKSTGQLDRQEQKTESVRKISKIENYLEDQADQNALHGVVLIAKGDAILLKEAYGYIDLDHTEKHQIAGKIGLASMPKMFTALAIMQLASGGKIDINAPLGHYLKDVTNPVWRNKITVKNLLSHTSGLGFYWDYPPEELSSNLNSLYQVIKKRDADPQDQGAFNYSNNGYIVLGKIIEEVSGVPYKDYIKNTILTPLAMENTVLGLPDGGDFKSTVDDLFKFSKALRKNQLVGQELRNEMTSKQSNENYGLGFKLAFKKQSNIYGHTGGFASNDSGLGIASAFDIIDDTYTVIVLTNRNPGMGGPKARNYILNQLAKK